MFEELRSLFEKAGVSLEGLKVTLPGVAFTADSELTMTLNFDSATNAVLQADNADTLTADALTLSHCRISRRYSTKFVDLNFDILWPRSDESLASLKRMLSEHGPNGLTSITNEVQIVIRPRKATSGQKSVRISAAECARILKGRWPNDSMLDSLDATITELRDYPVADPKPTSEVSRDAQGQTKKPGSHSESRHR